MVVVQNNPYVGMAKCENFRVKVLSFCALELSRNDSQKAPVQRQQTKNAPPQRQQQKQRQQKSTLTDTSPLCKTDSLSVPLSQFHSYARIGYLTCNLFLHRDHELMLLLINTMQRDLGSANHIEVGSSYVKLMCVLCET